VIPSAEVQGDKQMVFLVSVGLASQGLVKRDVSSLFPVPAPA